MPYGVTVRVSWCVYVLASRVSESASVHNWMRASRASVSTRFLPWVCVCAGAICALDVCGNVCTRACHWVGVFSRTQYAH